MTFTKLKTDLYNPHTAIVEADHKFSLSPTFIVYPFLNNSFLFNNNESTLTLVDTVQKLSNKFDLVPHNAP